MSKRLFLVAVILLAGAFALLAGSFVSDPLGSIRRLQEARLHAAGARIERFAARDGSMLRVFELGPLSAEVPVVLLHGLGASGDYWASAAIALAKAGRTVLLPDAPGSGGSAPPRSRDGYGIPARVEALRSLFAALGLERIDLVGHSLGGWAAARFAIEEPHRVRRLVLVDSGGFFLPPGGETSLKAALTPRDREGGRRLVDLLFFRKPFPVFGFVADAFARRYGGEDSVVATVEKLTAADGLDGHEGALPRGTVLIWGAEETLFPIDGARTTLSRIPDARLLVLRGVGHDGPLEAPREFQVALDAALDGRPIAGR